MTPKKITLATKTCNTCNLKKNHSEFWKQKSNRDGLFGECKECSSKRNLKWTDKNRVYVNKKVKTSTRKRRLHNPKIALFYGAKNRAKRKGIPFSLNPDEFIVPDICPVLGMPMKSKSGTCPDRKMGGVWHDDSPSLDRIDSSLGYINGNVVIVSLRANRLKSNASITELKAIVKWYDELENSRRTISIGDISDPPKEREQQDYVSAMLSFPA